MKGEEVKKKRKEKNPTPVWKKEEGTVAISNHSFKIEPRMAISTIQINGLSNQFMPVLSNTVSTHIF